MWLGKAFCLLIAATLAGCAGTNFVRPGPDLLKNGETTYAQVTAKFGQPYQEGTVVRNEQTLKAVNYAYASVGGRPLNEGVTAARAIGLYFHNDTLVGHEFISSWAEDHTNFDDGKVPQIIRGKSTRSDVIQLLGAPGGSYVYPMVKSPGDDAAVYAYLEVRGFTPFRKLLIVTFDRTGTVSDVEYTTQGKAEARRRRPPPAPDRSPGSAF
jgi:hypothetical protein